MAVIHLDNLLEPGIRQLSVADQDSETSGVHNGLVQSHGSTLPSAPPALANTPQFSEISDNDQRAIAPVNHLGLLRVRELGRRVFATRNRHNELHCSSTPAIRKREDVAAMALDDHFANA